MKTKEKNNLPKSGIVCRYCLLILLIPGMFSISNAQSTSQNSPTPITSNEIKGTIPARDIGDSRLTNHFYIFNGNQGDVFINVVTKNLDGDIDVFTVDGLKPLTKITIFSDTAESETGRVVYLRKFEKLLLRIQGRSPNDEPATYGLKFAGSFVPLENVADFEQPQLPDVANKDQGEVQVNSVGTIIAIIPKPTPQPEEIPVEVPTSAKEINVRSVDEKTIDEASTKIEIKKEQTPENQTEIENKEVETSSSGAKPVVIITDNSIPDDDPQIAEKKPDENASLIEPKDEKVETTTAEKVLDTAGLSADTSKEIAPVDPKQLVSIQLIIKFKDGQIIKHLLNNVFTFNVNQGILRIVLNDGKVSKYSMLDVEKVSIEQDIR